MQTELARIASELARRFCIPDNAPDAELYHPLLGGLPPRRSEGGQEGRHRDHRHRELAVFNMLERFLSGKPI